ncbi:MAG: PKD domain-containing protein, partial [Candidatus Thermoplasmatota archaeon]|nr:PKD domain-containing protein [Candidatus Thermoplasmatota archaeon]
NSTNRPPQLESFAYNVSSGAFALPNEILNFTLSISDPERDSIQVIVDFGDNSTILYLNLTEFGEGNITTVHFSHSYEKVGNFTINITYTDNKQGLFKHTKYIENEVWVHSPPVIAEDPWNWWDSTSLGLLCGLILLGIGRLLYVERRRKKIEAQGMTYDEWRLLSTEMPEEIDVRKEGGS